MNEIFFRVFKNKILFQLIFANVYHIHRYTLKEKVVKWNKLLNNINLLSYYNYLNEIKQHHNNRINKDIFQNNNKLIEYITRGDSLDVLQYIIHQQPHLLTFNTQTSYPNQKKTIKTDLLYYSVKYNSLKIFNYLESFTNNDKDNNIKKRKTSIISSPASSLSTTNEIEWDYYHSISIVPLSGNMVLFLYLFDKVDIRNTLINKTNNNDEYSDIIEFIFNSAGYGRSEMLDHLFKYLESDQYLLDDILINRCPTIFERIIRNGHLNIIKQYYNINSDNIQNKLQFTDLILQCITYNRLEMMKYFHKNHLGTSKSVTPIDNAIENGNLEMIKWLHENRTEGCTTYAIDNAALNGHLEIIKWLHENRTEGCTTNAMDQAALNGHLEVVKWLHYNRTEGCTTDAMDNAVHGEHLEIVKWLHENRTIGCTDAINILAENGHLEMIKWLHHNRIEGFTSKEMDNAAKNGHLEIVKWLHENRTEGCTINAMNFAAQNGHLDIIKWLHENRTEGCTTRAMDSAASCGLNGHIEIIKWLHENRTEGCTTFAMNMAASHGHFEIIKWLHENRTEGCTDKAMYDAAKNGHFEIIKWFQENRPENCKKKNPAWMNLNFKLPR